MSSLVYVHPVGGSITVTLIVILAVLGLRSRHRARYAPGARQWHRRLSWLVMVAFAGSGSAGLSSTYFLRSDIDPATTWHAIAAGVALVLMGGLFALGRRVPASATARLVHPWLGYGLLITAAALLVFGLSLLP